MLYLYIVQQDFYFCRHQLQFTNVKLQKYNVLAFDWIASLIG